jgi:MFS family permease
MKIAASLRSPWWIVLASALGLSVGTGTINVMAFAEFLKPLSHNLGLGRGELSAAVGLSTVVGALCSPVFGRIVDRWGVRRSLLPFIALYAAAVALLSQLDSSSLRAYALFALVGAAGMGQSPAVYARAVKSAFDKDHGTALGLALSGIGVGAVMVPILSATLIAHLGWRLAYVGLALTVLLLAFLPLLLFIPDRRSGAARSGGRAAGPPPGLDLAEALAGWRLWALAVSFFLASTAMLGVLAHVVALLTDRGMPVSAATAAMSAAGIAIIVGRIVSGLCLDRFFGPHVAVVHFACPAAGIALLWAGVGGIMPIVAMALCGIGIGALYGLIAFFVGRYFGVRSFGTLYGIVFGASLLGIAAGSNGMGWSYQLLGSYEPAELGFVVSLVVSCLVFLLLGPYAFPAAGAPRGGAAAAIESQPTFVATVRAE